MITGWIYSKLFDVRYTDYVYLNKKRYGTIIEMRLAIAFPPVITLALLGFHWNRLFDAILCECLFGSACGLWACAQRLLGCCPTHVTDKLSWRIPGSYQFWWIKSSYLRSEQRYIFVSLSHDYRIQVGPKLCRISVGYVGTTVRCPYSKPKSSSIVIGYICTY